MIDLVSNNHIQQMLKSRKKKYVLGKSLFYILTPLNHVFRFDNASDLCVVSPNLTRGICSPETLEAYGLSYGRPSSAWNPLSVYLTKDEEGGEKQIKAFYESCITDPAYMFFLHTEKSELNQELQHRGLI